MRQRQTLHEYGLRRVRRRRQAAASDVTNAVALALASCGGLGLARWLHRHAHAYADEPDAREAAACIFWCISCTFGRNSRL